MTDVRERLARFLAAKAIAASDNGERLPDNLWTQKLPLADAILAAFPELTAAPGKDVVEGAREIASQVLRNGWGEANRSDLISSAIAAFATACVAKETERHRAEVGKMWSASEEHRRDARHWEEKADTLSRNLAAEQRESSKLRAEVERLTREKARNVMTEFAWVIEHRLSPMHSPNYWAGNGWSTDHMRAIRFARKEDAERTRNGLDDEFALDHRVAEHGWDNIDGDDPNATITPVTGHMSR